MATSYHECYSSWDLVEVDREIKTLSWISLFLKFSESTVSLEDRHLVQLYIFFSVMFCYVLNGLARNQIFNTKRSLLWLHYFYFWKSRSSWKCWTFKSELPKVCGNTLDSGLWCVPTSHPQPRIAGDACWIWGTIVMTHLCRALHILTKSSTSILVTQRSSARSKTVLTLGFSAQILCYSLAVMSSWALCLCDTDLSMYWSVMTMKAEKSNILKWFYGPIIYVMKECLVVKYAHSDLVWWFSKCVSPCKLSQHCLRIHSSTPFIDISFSFHFTGVCWNLRTIIISIHFLVYHVIIIMTSTSHRFFNVLFLPHFKTEILFKNILWPRYVFSRY